ncbi:hypothetical protein EW145_g7981 [Phellinidium pouzarii]|uniref:Uncharacterized protein n=1 Tax=Phellinidium pouzarii TaxID=167371 RepID=A0A4V3X9S6_9AGAM|nr:hypothetical protein EW145_g7981 [Phellinidium pouzarii]
MFGRSSRSPRHSAHNNARGGQRRFGLFHRANPDHRAGGYKAALHNPNTTHEGRTHAKHELREMGRGNEAHGHPSFKSRLRHMFGIRSRPSRNNY